MRWLQAVGAAALLIAAVPCLAAEPRQPSDRWVVDFDDAQCVASRNYGTADEPLMLVIKAPPAGNVVQIGVMRRATGGQAEQIETKVAFDEAKPVRTSMLAYSVKHLKMRAFLINLPIDQFSLARQAQTISIHGKRELKERFAISAIGPLMKLMDECVADLRTAWNIGGPDSASKGLREPVSGDLQGLIRSSDYPGESVSKGQQGTVTFVLLIDESGKVADCTVTETSGVAFLDSQSCAITKLRARFKPAIGLDGRPAKGSFIQRISWRVGN